MEPASSAPVSPSSAPDSEASAAATESSRATDAAGARGEAERVDGVGARGEAERVDGVGARGEAGRVDDGAGAPSAAGAEQVDDGAGAPSAAEAEPVVGAGAAPAPRLARGQERSPRDMAMSLAVLIIPIALLLIFYRVVLSGDAPVTVDPAPTIQEARQANAFPVVVPQGLGDDWHASSATFVRQPAGATLRIGYVDPDDDPVQLIESSVPAATLLPAELTTSAKPLSTFRATNGVWRLYDGRPGEQALILSDGSRTIIVLGATDVRNLESLAASLR